MRDIGSELESIVLSGTIENLELKLQSTNIKIFNDCDALNWALAYDTKRRVLALLADGREYYGRYSLFQACNNMEALQILINAMKTWSDQAKVKAYYMNALDFIDKREFHTASIICHYSPEPPSSHYFFPTLSEYIRLYEAPKFKLCGFTNGLAIWDLMCEKVPMKETVEMHCCMYSLPPELAIRLVYYVLRITNPVKALASTGLVIPKGRGLTGYDQDIVLNGKKYQLTATSDHFLLMLNAASEKAKEMLYLE